MVKLVFVALCLAAVSLACMVPRTMADQAEVGKFLEDGRLAARLEVRDAQEGFVGVSGTVWTVEPDGVFRVQRFVNDRLLAPSNEGQLRREDLAEIARTLAAQRFDSLPATIGTQGVNARRLVIRFGSGSSTAFLEPTESPESVAREPLSDRGRLLAIARTVRALIEKTGARPL